MRMSQRARPHQAPTTRPRPRIVSATPAYWPGRRSAEPVPSMAAITPITRSSTPSTYIVNGDRSRGRRATTAGGAAAATAAGSLVAATSSRPEDPPTPSGARAGCRPR